MSESAPDAATATTGRSVIRGGAWNLASRAVPQFDLVVVSIAAARFLGPDRMGRQSLIAFSAVTAVTVFTAGFPDALIRFVGYALGRGEPSEARGLLRLGWRVEAAGALAAAAVLAAVAAAGAVPRAAWVLAAVVAALGVLVKVPSAFLIGVQRWRDASVAGLATGTAGAAATVAVLAVGAGITGMFAVEAVVAAVTLALLWRFARRASASFEVPASPSEVRRGELFRYTVASSVTVLITIVVWRRSELFFLQHYATDREIAFYSIAFAAVAAPIAVLQGLTAAFLPAVATLFGAGQRERIRAGYSRAARLIVVATLPLTAAGLALGPELLRIAYGPEYARAGSVFLIVVSVLPLIPLASLASATLNAMGRLWVQIGIGICASVLDIVLDLALIPGHGAIGAAVANVAAQAVLAGGIVVYADRMLHGTGWGGSALLRAALASALGGVAAWAVVHWLGGVTGFVVGAAVGVATFSVLARALRILTPDDATWLDGVLGSALGGRASRIVRFWAVPPGLRAP